MACAGSSERSVGREEIPGMAFQVNHSGSRESDTDPLCEPLEVADAANVSHAYGCRLPAMQRNIATLLRFRT